MKPLLKWAGGKRQMLPDLIRMLPDSWNSYLEPFAGGLALFSELCNRSRISSGKISDTNPELINFYRVVKKFPDDLIESLAGYRSGNFASFYYRCRAEFNEIRGSDNRRVERAALFLYLNRHCYNGLWRVNRMGEFNVPFGKYVKPYMPDRQWIMEFHSSFDSVEIAEQDFAESTLTAKPGDLVYFDPPYSPVSKTSNFTDYTAGGFQMEDQERLRRICIDLDRKGVNFILSNSFSREMLELFADFNCMRVSARRNINSVAGLRSGHSELIVTNAVRSLHSRI